MSTRRTKITLHDVIIHVKEEHVGAFFTDYGQLEEGASLTIKTCTANGDIILKGTMFRKCILEIADTLTCQGPTIFIVVEDRRPHCWSYGAAEHMSKACPTKNTTPKLRQITVTTKAIREKKSDKAPECWKEVRS